MKLFKRRYAVGTEQGTPPGTDGAGFRGTLVTAVSDTGCVRRNNEDNYLLDIYINESCGNRSEVSAFLPWRPSGWNLIGIFDGMGGGEKGELAALVTAQEFRNAARELLTAPTGAEADEILRRAFRRANDRAVELQARYGTYGTTGTVVCTNGEVFKIYHLGDSRAYLLRQQELFQLTRDHTLARMKLEAGLYQEDDPQVERDKNRLTEYIGRDEAGGNLCPEESKWIPAAAGDCILLCSDGLYDMCPATEIRKILNQGADNRCKTGMLVQRALERGGRDNVTCICLDFAQK